MKRKALKVNTSIRVGGIPTNHTRNLLKLLAVVAVLVAPAAARAAVLCCDMVHGAACFWSSTGSCPPPTSSNQYMSVATQSQTGGAQVQTQTSGAFDGLCFKDHATAAPGDYVAPSICVRLIAPASGPLVQVSEAFTPWNGNAFAFEGSPNFREWFGGLFMSCYAGSALRDEQGVVTQSVGSGYTCGPVKQMSWNSTGAGGGTHHFLPAVNTAPFLGINPRLYAAYGTHLVQHYDLFLVRMASPNAAIVWHRTVNGANKPEVTLGTTDQYGSADVWFPAWTQADAGANTMWVTAGSFFTSNTIAFQVQ